MFLRALGPVVAGTALGSISDILSGNDQFSTLLTAVSVAGLGGALEKPGHDITIFAPVNDAFDEVPEEVKTKYLQDPQWKGHLQDFLLYHVVEGSFVSTDLMNNKTEISTLNDFPLTVYVDPISLQDASGGIAHVIDPFDIVAEGGVVHAVDKVLFPPSAVQSIADIAIAKPEMFSTLVDLVVASGLDTTLSEGGPFTVLAPTNDAFAELGEEVLQTLADDIDALKNILLYHVIENITLSSDLSDGQMITTVEGTNVTVTFDDDGALINDADVVHPDILASNGVIHVVSKVLLPPATDEVPEAVEKHLEEASNTIVDVAIAANFTTLVSAVKAANLVDALMGDGPFTVFAPRDEAFSAMPKDDLLALLDDPTGQLQDILLYHVVAGSLNSSNLEDGQELETLQGSTIKVAVNGTHVVLNGVATVVAADVYADNGVIHVIDSVLIPPVDGTEYLDGKNETLPISEKGLEDAPDTIVDVAIAANFTTLVAAVKAADLVDALVGKGPFTVFAPTNEAFAAIPQADLLALLDDPMDQLQDILLYHVVAGTFNSSNLEEGQELKTLEGSTITVAVNGSQVILNGVATVVTADVHAANGIIHVIDTVLLPTIDGEADDSHDTNETLVVSEKCLTETPDTIVDVAIASNFSTLVTAVVAADLVDELMGDGPFTVFAPTDAAFVAIPEDDLLALLEDPTGKLQDILLYHVVAGAVNASDLEDGQELETLEGSAIKVSLNGSQVVLNGVATVVTADVHASNGVIHVIDAVLLPPSDEHLDDAHGNNETLPVSEKALEETSNTIVDVAIAANFSTLVAAVQAADLVDALMGEGPFTVFAPTDAAFAAISEVDLLALLDDPLGDLKDILLYHVLPDKVASSELGEEEEVHTLEGSSIKVSSDGSAILLNGVAMVVTADVQASNGVIHVIDTVLLPPQEESDEEEESMATIAELAGASSDFATLVYALNEAGLVDVLAGEGNFTVFAPNEDAFEKIDAASLGSLLADVDALKDLLLYHVVSDRILASDLEGGMKLETVQGEHITVTSVQPSVTLNGDATVVQADIVAGNGVIHVIDTVLFPSGENVDLPVEAMSP